MLGARMRQSTRTGADRTLDLLEAQVGRSLAEVETPVAVVDLDRLEANLRDLQSYADAHGIALWPHTKTHKSPEIGMLQLELGAGGLTVAKTGEAQVFRDAGATRLLVHYPPIGEAKWERLAQLAAEGLDLTVAVDGVYAAPRACRPRSPGAARSATLLVEMDVGLHRTGQTTASGALALAQQLSGLPAVEVAGISCYPGHCRGDDATIRAPGRGGRRAPARDARRLPRIGPALRPHLRRLDADALPDARDLRERAALGLVRAARPHRRAARAMRAARRGDGHLRRGARARS